MTCFGNVYQFLYKVLLAFDKFQERTITPFLKESRQSHFFKVLTKMIPRSIYQPHHPRKITPTSSFGRSASGLNLLVIKPLTFLQDLMLVVGGALRKASM